MLDLASKKATKLTSVSGNGREILPSGDNVYVKAGDDFCLRDAFTGEKREWEKTASLFGGRVNYIFGPDGGIFVRRQHRIFKDHQNGFTVTAYRKSGEKAWVQSVSDSPHLELDPCYHQGVLLVEMGKLTPKLTFINAETGELCGYIQLNAPLVASPLSAGEMVFFGTGDKKLHAYRVMKTALV